MRFRGTFIPRTWTATAIWVAGWVVLTTATTVWSSPWWVIVVSIVAWTFVIQLYEGGEKHGESHHHPE